MLQTPARTSGTGRRQLGTKAAGLLVKAVLCITNEIQLQPPLTEEEKPQQKAASRRMRGKSPFPAQLQHPPTKPTQHRSEPWRCRATCWGSQCQGSGGSLACRPLPYCQRKRHCWRPPVCGNVLFTQLPQATGLGKLKSKRKKKGGSKKEALSPLSLKRGRKLD